MNKDFFKDKIAVVFDYGIFFCLALKLSETFGKVKYYAPWKSGFPTSNDREIGSGFDEVERIYDFEKAVLQADKDKTLFCFPDIYDGFGWQALLKKMGFRVWGSGEGEAMEIERWEFIQYMKKLGMPVPPSELVTGTQKLREILEKAKDSKVIKTDAKERGDIETFKALEGEFDITEIEINNLEQRIGMPYAHMKKFIVQDFIPDIITELGYDGFVVDGQFPEQTLFGREVKGLGYVGEVRKYMDLPEGIRYANEKLKSTFKSYGYRGSFSSEVVDSKDGKHYLIDPCCRQPSPPTEVMIEIWANMAECMWQGSEGKLLQPEYKAKYAAELIIHSDWARTNDSTLFYPDDMKQWVKQRYVTQRDGKIWVLKQTKSAYNQNTNAGSVVAIAGTMKAVVDLVKERAQQIRGKGLEVDVNCIDSAVEEMNKL